MGLYIDQQHKLCETPIYTPAYSIVEIKDKKDNIFLTMVVCHWRNIGTEPGSCVACTSECYPRCALDCQIFLVDILIFLSYKESFLVDEFLYYINLCGQLSGIKLSKSTSASKLHVETCYNTIYYERQTNKAEKSKHPIL